MTLGLDPREQTLGDVLRLAGYRCGMVGKWDMGQARRYLPLQRGFDFFYGHGNNGIDYYTHERYGIHSMFAGNAADEGRPGDVRDGFVQARGAAVHRREQVAAVVSVPLLQRAARGVELWLGREQPQVAERRAGTGRIRRQICRCEAAENLKRYYAAVTCMDDAIGEILKLLDETRQTDNTLVIFQSDNGGSGNGGNAPLRGQQEHALGRRPPRAVRRPLAGEDSRRPRQRRISHDAGAVADAGRRRGHGARQRT